MKIASSKKLIYRRKQQTRPKGEDESEGKCVNVESSPYSPIDIDPQLLPPKRTQPKVIQNHHPI
jgi:hypothetical protein